MENEVMNYAEEVMVPEFETVVMDGDGSCANSVVKVLFTVGGAAVIGIAAWLGKKLYDNSKKRKELRQPDEDEFVEVTDEQIDEVTK